MNMLKVAYTFEREEKKVYSYSKCKNEIPTK